MKTMKSFTVTLSDSVRYMLEVAATDPHEAEQKALDVWHEDFLKFSPITAGEDIHDVDVSENGATQ